MNILIKPIEYIKFKIFEKKFSKTINLINNHLNWKKRKTGEAMFMHSYRMFKKCIESWIYDEIVLNSILLHDIIEDWDFTINEINTNFGYSTSCIIKWMTWVDENKLKFNKNDYFVLFKKYCDYDWRILFVKLFDCIDNLETIHWLSKERQSRFIQEKREVYLPIFEEYTTKIPLKITNIYIKKVSEFKKLLV